MFARGTIVSMQLSPLVSIKSWRVMAVGSMWCSLNGRMKACKTEQKPAKTLFRTTGQAFKKQEVEPLPFQRWGGPLIPKCRPPSEPVLKQSLPWVFPPLKRGRRHTWTTAAVNASRFVYDDTYRYSAGWTTNVPDESWQVGEWSWRPWEKSRGWHLAILDIFCLEKTRKPTKSSLAETPQTSRLSAPFQRFSASHSQNNRE